MTVFKIGRHTGDCAILKHMGRWKDARLCESMEDLRRRWKRHLRRKTGVTWEGGSLKVGGLMFSIAVYNSMITAICNIVTWK